jgi:glycosyltransferase involved in cell wall biosynthesis
MKVSLCIPQYNRIPFLLKNLEFIAQQTYPNIEVVISDDASTDNTLEEIEKLKSTYKYPLIYFRHQVNIGYDANLRKSLELSTGDYCITLGNDDTINKVDDIERIVSFLQANDLPELGFCNYIEDHNRETIITRASTTQVIGTGDAIALKYYRSFSYVAGIIIRKDVFNQVNTNKVDGSVYVQMYFAARIISNGGRLFMYKEPVIIKDIRINGSMANSYRDTLMRSWKELKPIDGGLKQVIWAVTEGFKDAGVDLQRITYKVLKNIYQFTYTYWLLDYRSNGSFVGAVAMMKGLKPSGVLQWSNLSFIQKCKIRGYYYVSTGLGLLVPVKLFLSTKHKIYKLIKR